MRAILVLYLVDVFRYSEENASSIYAFYLAACYFTPLIGGLVADRVLNKYWTIVAFAVPYVLGQFLVGLSNEYLMFGALGLLAFGSGVIKPNISTLMGLTYDEKRPGQGAANLAFTLFYVAINIGSALSTIICPELRNYFGVVIDEETNALQNPQAGYFAAFLFPAVLMSRRWSSSRSANASTLTRNLASAKTSRTPSQPRAAPKSSLSSANSLACSSWSCSSGPSSISTARPGPTSRGTTLTARSASSA